MDVFAAIETRRSVKDFDPHHHMTGEEIHRLLSLAVLSPTAFNLQHWRFVIIDDPQQRQLIREVAWDQTQVTDASLLIVLCADIMAWQKDPLRFWRDAPQEVQELVVPAITRYYNGNAQAQRDEAMRSCGIAAQTLMLAAQAMGYDSCPMDGFDFDAVARLINLPEDHLISMFVAIGKKTRDIWPRSGQLSLDDVVIHNNF